MLSRTTTNHINLPQQKTFTYHSPLPFLNLHSRNYFLTTSRWRPPRSGFFPVGESLNIINSIQFNSIGPKWHAHNPHAMLSGSFMSMLLLDLIRVSDCRCPKWHICEICHFRMTFLAIFPLFKKFQIFVLLSMFSESDHDFYNTTPLKLSMPKGIHNGVLIARLLFICY